MRWVPCGDAGDVEELAAARSGGAAYAADFPAGVQGLGEHVRPCPRAGPVPVEPNAAGMPPFHSIRR
jgi:hypothetical protein